MRLQLCDFGSDYGLAIGFLGVFFVIIFMVGFSVIEHLQRLHRRDDWSVPDFFLVKLSD